MKFLVFIKQVPDATHIQFDPHTKTLLRHGVKNIINPYDRRAISEAVRYRNDHGGEVIIATMGPPQARYALAEALVMGADRAIHISDPALAGSDTLVTARVLAVVAQKIGFDIIICGQHSTDSETAQVPVQLAELLTVPCATAVEKIEYLEARLRVHCETDAGIIGLEVPLPAVLTAAERLIKPIKVKDVDLDAAAATDKIELLSLDDLRLTADEVGFSGSPTWVESIHEQRIVRQPHLIQGMNPSETAGHIFKLVQKALSYVDLFRQAVPPVNNVSDTEGQIWCWVEKWQDEIRAVTLETLSHAAVIAQNFRASVAAVFVGAPPNRNTVDLLSSYGADKIYYGTSTLPHYDEVTLLLDQQIRRLSPHTVFFPATAEGRYLASRIAARRNLGLVGDCVGIGLDEEGKLVFLKPAFGGNIIAFIYSKTSPQLATIRPGALDLLTPREPEHIPTVAWAMPNSTTHTYERISEEKNAAVEAIKLDTAEIVICVGMGLGQENIPLAFRLADLLGGAVGATRRVVDSGWLPRQFQIGLTGKFVAPQTYIGLGVSGRYNHTIGIQKARHIIAVNNNPEAEIFKLADTGIVGDCVAIAKEMIRLLEGTTAES